LRRLDQESAFNLSRLVGQWEVLLARSNRNGEPVLPWRERADVVLAVCAVRIVGEVEVDHVLVGRPFFDVQVARGAVRFLSGGRIPERDEEALVLMVVA